MPIVCNILVKMMRCQVNSTTATMLLAILLSMPAWAKQQLVPPQDSFADELGGGKSVSIILESDRYFVETKGVRHLLKEGAVITQRGDEVIFLDVNEDGLKDVFIKVMDARVESVYVLYVSKEVGDIRLDEYPELFGSPYVDEGGLLISVRHNGPYSHIKKYKGVAGEFYPIESRDPVSPDMEKVIVHDRLGSVISNSIKFLGSNDDASGCVSFLTDVYDAPNFNTPIGSVAADSLIQVKDVSDASGWFYIFHQESNLSGWIQQERFKLDCD